MWGEALGPEIMLLRIKLPSLYVCVETGSDDAALAIVDSAV